MTKDYTDKHFDDIMEFDAIASSLPPHHFETLHRGKEVEKEEGENQLDLENERANALASAEEDRVAIVNEETKEMVAVASTRYDLQQHEQVLRPVIEALRDLGLDVEGRVRLINGGSYINVEARIKNQNFEIEDDSEYMTGFFFRNSCDKSSSIGAEAFYERMVCSNGMVIKDHVIPPLEQIHLGENDVVEMYKDWFEELLEKSKYLREKLVSAQQEWVEFEEALTYAGFPEQNWQDIKPKIQHWAGDRVKQKELYDAITNYTTHEAGGVSHKTRLRYQRQAERLLYATPQKIEEYDPEMEA